MSTLAHQKVARNVCAQAAGGSTCGSVYSVVAWVVATTHPTSTRQHISMRRGTPSFSHLSQVKLRLVLRGSAVPGAGATPESTSMTGPASSDSASARIAYLRGVRAVRQLRSDPLPEPVLHDILEVARWSGSAGNRQPWEFIVVCGRVQVDVSLQPPAPSKYAER
jgi:hypothetical protein